ncbi:MAG: indolepyruvate ferredoxin oxidoreductase [Proteobacteria bacterium]|nr:indolepyruvate ferredoxin oxidoreductase [Pseudomonadota bacterium]
MPEIDIDAPGKTMMLMGNEAVARGALEAGVGFAAAYPGTPSTEILPTLAGVAKRRNLYAEWSINEIVALMNAAAASNAGIRSMAAMKQNGTNVATDMIANLVNRGLRNGGGLVLVNCDDPSGRNSPNEQDTRSIAKMLDVPMLEPGDFQEAKEMTKWLYELSEALDGMVMLRMVAKISHTRGNVTLGELSTREQNAHFDLVPQEPPVRPTVPPVDWMTRHAYLHDKLNTAMEMFETSPFNRYHGSDDPELLIICCGASYLYSMEALRVLGLQDRVGILKLGTIWPLPEKLIKRYLVNFPRILFVEEVDPFVERSVMELSASFGPAGPHPTYYGKRSGHIPSYGDLDPDKVIQALARILELDYQPRDPEYAEKVQAAARDKVIDRLGTMCPGCPHRASFWAINKALRLDGREGFATSDAGCMSSGMRAGGFNVAKIMSCMGGGAGLADGFGKLKRFGFTQPVIGGEGDSSFYHASIPPLLNAVWNQSDFTLVVYDNSTTAMTGFQPNPGNGITAMGEPGRLVPIEDICRALGIRVEICDPFELEKTTEILLDILRDENHGPRVVIMRHECELQRARREKPAFEMAVNPEKCLGESCGCDRLCTRIFRCSGLRWNAESGRSEIDEMLCCGCGLCTDVCPQGAIEKKAMATIINEENATEEGARP